MTDPHLDVGVLSDVAGVADRLLPGDALQDRLRHRRPDLPHLHRPSEPRS